jgi:hypothetical protein
MTFEPIHKGLPALRDLAPYFLVEPLLPGGTLVALLLWLSQMFVRDGFGGVRQYLHAPRTSTVIAANRTRSAATRRFCAKSCAVVAAWSGRIVQWCKSLYCYG